ncbi:acyl-CoA dehydrogenase [Streptomyces sp. NPDC048523]|uniref:acyl-CoA dehydrogenase n=1 Tax=Streptomyces sp. NPDC048523 TaxID=3365567 RepID=UPI00370FFF6C
MTLIRDIVAPPGAMDRRPHLSPRPAATYGRTAALGRAARLDTLLDNPYDPANEHGFAAFLAADQERRPARSAERLLADAGLAAEFVPARQGGTLARADLLMKVLRPVFRRDVALGFAGGVTSLFAASAVWAAGTGAQQQALAHLLLGGGRTTVVHPGLAPAGGVRREEVTARRTAKDTALLVSGRKDVIIDAARADLYVVHARTADTGPRTHSVLLLDPAQLPGATLQRLPRVATDGMRGAVFSGLQFTRCPVSDDALVGRPGDGAALALRMNQVNRCLVAGAATAALDPVLRAAVHTATDGRTGPPARRWHRPLAGVFTDLLVCDALATVCLRAVGLLPDRAHAPTVAATYTVPVLLTDALEELSAVLGTHGGGSDVVHGILAKLVRDLPAAGLGRDGAAACQAVILPQLSALARQSWLVEQEPPAELFRARGDPPPLDHGALAFAGGGDFLAAALTAAAERLGRSRRAGGSIALLAELAEGFLTELHLLREQCALLPGQFGDALSGPAACALSDRYGLLAAAGAVLALWEGQEGDDPFLADPGWVVLALSRLGRRLGIELPDLPGNCVTGVLDELLRRHHSGRSFDLDVVDLAL